MQRTYNRIAIHPWAPRTAPRSQRRNQTGEQQSVQWQMYKPSGFVSGVVNRTAPILTLGFHFPQMTGQCEVFFLLLSLVEVWNRTWENMVKEVCNEGLWNITFLTSSSVSLHFDILVQLEEGQNIVFTSYSKWDKQNLIGPCRYISHVALRISRWKYDISYFSQPWNHIS